MQEKSNFSLNPLRKFTVRLDGSFFYAYTSYCILVGFMNLILILFALINAQVKEPNYSDFMRKKLVLHSDMQSDCF